MTKHHAWSGVVLALLLYLGAASAAELVLQAGSYRLHLEEKKAYAIQRFSCNGWEFIQNKGANGVILAELSGKYIGCDGAEKLVSLEITADGKKAAPAAGAAIQGRNITVRRVSRLNNLTSHTTWVLTPDGLEWRWQYQTEQTAQKIHSLYLSALSLNPSTDKYHAIAQSGAAITGDFQNKGGWQVNSNIHYLGCLDSKRNQALLIYYPEIIKAAGRKATVWDLKVYHKFYHQLPVFKQIAPDMKSREYVFHLSCIPANIQTWTQDIQQAAQKLNKEYKKVEKFTGRTLNKFTPPNFGDTSKDDWAVNRRGVEALDPDFVLPPFENIRVDRNGTRVWNRDYQLNQFGMLKQARIAGEDFLGGSQTLNLRINGKDTVFRFVGRNLILSKKGRSVHESTLASPQMVLKVLTTIEYDGMVRVDLTMIPETPLTIDHFDYGFVLPRQHAQFIHFIGGPRVNNLSIMIPKESFTFKVPEKDGRFFSEAFKSLVWFGNMEKGFLWFSESEQHFSPQDYQKRPEALTAEVRSGNVHFTVTPVRESYRIQQPVTYTFGFFATPVRPMPKDWRNWSFTTRRAMYGSEMQHGHVGTMPMIWPDEFRAVGALPRLDEKDIARVKGYIDELHAQGRPALTYIDPIRVGFGYLKYLDYKPNAAQLSDLFVDGNTHTADAFCYMVPEVAANFNNWKTQPELIYSYGASRGGRELRVSSASGWADFFCFLLEKWAKLGFDGFGDIDNCFPIRDQNPIHNAGYVDQHGKRHWTWDWFARRDLMKRISATMLKARNGRPGILVAHSSATWSIPFLSFCDANMVYENSNSGYFSSKSFYSPYGKDNEKIYRDIRENGAKKYLRWAFPLDRWQGEYTGHQFGLPVVIMSNLTKSPQVDKTYAASIGAARELLMQAAAHDCIYWPIWCNPTPLVEWTKMREKFGIGQKDVKFHPYWSPDSPVKTGAAGILPTVYQRPGESLVMISNWNEVSSEAEIAFPGYRGAFTVLNGENNGKLELAGGKLKLSIPARDYRILLIKH